MSQAISIENVGPIEALSIPIPEGGGVVVLRGHNGAGKTHALGAAQALARGDGRVEKRDGSLGATVEGLGVRLQVMRRASRAGELEVPQLDGPDPSVLVDPGLKDEAAADAQRIKALCLLARAEPSLDDFGDLVGGRENLALYATPKSMQGDVVSVAASLKRDFQAKARDHESAAVNFETEAKGLEEAVADVPSEELNTAESQEELEDALSTQASMKERQRGNRELLEQAARAKEALLEFGVAGTVAEVEAAEKNQRHLFEEVKQLESELAKNRAALESANTALEQARADARRRSASERAVAAAEGVEPVPDSMLESVAQRVQRARELIETGGVRRRAAEQRRKATERREAAKKETAEAQRMRMASQGCDDVLNKALAKVLPDGLAVEGGRLLADHPTREGMVLFGQLSHGERWRFAIEIAVAAAGAGAVLVARQEAWEGLDPQNRADVARLCRKAGAVLLTAEATEGELCAEVA